mgnify:CR=1 FL=1|jgi:transcriptional regulator with XRE-family HTH domain
MFDTLQLVTRLFGSTREVAAVTGVTPVAVRAWRRRKSIPARHIAALLAAAKRRGYRLEASDFFSARRK